MKITPRIVFVLVFLVCAVLIGAALYLQEQEALEPCPMCILQRYAFVLVGAVSLVAAIHGPRGGWALRVYGGLATLFSLAGAGVAARHTWIQVFPPQTESCGTDLEFLVNTFPISQALPKIFAGTGSCSKVDWTMLGLSLPNWALLWFLAFTVATVWVAFVRRAG
ncbi:MAG TPA: disulfide bond formation protein B [Usitatibacter sp.]|nr:disulfide bond formation protein B [Usitatibacter sp.]